MSDAELPEHVRANRAYWDGMAEQWVAAGERSWRTREPTWGIWEISDAELGLLPADMSGLSAIELGCGTGYFSAWMARRGARVFGIDNSQKQLETARRLAAEHGVELELEHGNAERVPRPDGSFDFALSEYGAAIWCDPQVWIPEAHRLLRPGGELVFLGNSPWTIVCTPEDGDIVGERLVRSYFGLHRTDFTSCAIDPGGIEFNLPISAWMRLFRTTGFEVLDYIEIQAPEKAEGTRHFASAEWSRRFPCEHAWKLRKRG